MSARKEAYTLKGQLEAQDRAEVLKKCANMQRLLKPVKVINNCAPFLAYPFDRLQMSREFKKYITRLSGKNGSLITYEMLVDVNEDNRIKLLLTDEAELEKLMVEKRKVG